MGNIYGFQRPYYYGINPHYYGFNPNYRYIVNGNYYDNQRNVPMNQMNYVNNNDNNKNMKYVKPSFRDIPTIKFPYEIVKGINWKEYIKNTWYEMMYKANPQYDFEENCNGAIAQYDNIKGNSFQVLNTCLNDDKPFSQIGNAELLSKNEARLLVSFKDGLPQEVVEMQRKMGGNYWIIDYKEGVYSVITSPDQKYAWILARDPIQFESTQEYQDLKMKYKTLFEGAKERNVQIYTNS